MSLLEKLIIYILKCYISIVDQKKKMELISKLNFTVVPYSIHPNTEIRGVR